MDGCGLDDFDSSSSFRMIFCSFAIYDMTNDSHHEATKKILISAAHISDYTLRPNVPPQQKKNASHRTKGRPHSTYNKSKSKTHSFIAMISSAYTKVSRTFATDTLGLIQLFDLAPSKIASAHAHIA